MSNPQTSTPAASYSLRSSTAPPHERSEIFDHSLAALQKARMQGGKRRRTDSELPSSSRARSGPKPTGIDGKYEDSTASFSDDEDSERTQANFPYLSDANKVTYLQRRLDYVEAIHNGCRANETRALSLITRLEADLYAANLRCQQLVGQSQDDSDNRHLERSAIRRLKTQCETLKVAAVQRAKKEEEAQRQLSEVNSCLDNTSKELDVARGEAAKLRKELDKARMVDKALSEGKCLALEARAMDAEAKRDQAKREWELAFQADVQVKHQNERLELENKAIMAEKLEAAMRSERLKAENATLIASLALSKVDRTKAVGGMGDELAREKGKVAALGVAVAVAQDTIRAMGKESALVKEGRHAELIMWTERCGKLGAARVKDQTEMAEAEPKD